MKQKNVIIALDFPNSEQTLAFLDKFQNRKLFVKIGMELFNSAGPYIVQLIKSRGHGIFLDLKLHDIPTTVEKTMAVLSQLGVDMINLHASGTKAMMEAALRGSMRSDGTRPILLAVTQLTSTSEERMHGELLINGSIQDCVCHYAKMAQEVGLDGVVCSPLEAEIVHHVCGVDFLTVTPGIRFAGGEVGDQVRITTPAQAREIGSDYIVVGRPITAAKDPVAAYERCVEEFCGNIAERMADCLLGVKAVKLNNEHPFTWASGRKSPIYCDNRVTLSYPEIRGFIYQQFMEIVSKRWSNADVIAGVATGGIPHGVLVANALGKPFVYVRSEAKNHGLTNQIEGEIHPGQSVVVIEDLVSTGKSSLNAVNALREKGCNVLGMAAIFTYGLDVAVNNFADEEVELYTLTDYDTLVKVAHENEYVRPEDFDSLAAWRQNPGKWSDDHMEVEGS